MRLQRGRTIDRRRPFSRADARVAKLSLDELLSAKFRRLFFDVYVSSEVADTVDVRARAALAVNGPDASASHHTAAELWGGVVPAHSEVHVSVSGDHPRSERQGIMAHRRRSATKTTVHKGIRLTTPIETFRDLATLRLTLVELVVLGDSLVAAKHVTPEELVEASTSWTGPGCRLACRAAQLVRAGVDSPMESRLRMLLVLAGLPEPEINVIMRNEYGEWVMRVDLAYPALKVAVEYDGRQHAASTKQWQRDVRRREMLDRLGWRIVIVDAAGIFDRPAETLERVTSLLRERGVRVGRRSRSEWSRHFRPQSEIAA